MKGELAEGLKNQKKAFENRIREYYYDKDADEVNGIIIDLLAGIEVPQQWNLPKSVVDIDPLTKEQQEYFELKYATMRMMDVLKEKKLKGDLPQHLMLCNREHHPINVRYTWEALFYDYIHKLEEEHKESVENV